MPFNIGRREFIAVLGGAAASPLSARAQQLPGRTARIGLLQTSRDNPVVGRGYPAFLDELKKSGFSAGQNLTIEVVRTDQDSQRLFAETADLVRSNVELLVAEGSEIVLKAALAACDVALGPPRSRDRIGHLAPRPPFNARVETVRTRLCKEPGAAGWQHHRDRLFANRIGR